MNFVHSAVFFWCILLLLCKAEALLNIPKNVTIPAIFAFGDSIVDQGNNNDIPTLTRCNFPPYGRDLNGGVATGRFSNARTPPDILAHELGIKDLVPAYLDPHLESEDLLTGVSFASGGSGYDPLTPLLVSALSLDKQLEMFKEYIGKIKDVVGEEKANFIVGNSIYLVVSGSDDIANTYYTTPLRRPQYDINSYADFLVASASDFIKVLYEIGARRIAVFNLPPIGCVPSQRTLAGGPSRLCAEDHNKAAELVNSKLSSAMDSLKKMSPQAKIVIIDIYNPLLNLILHPQDYGFEVVDRGCCGTGEIEVVVLCNSNTPTCPDDTKYLFWDSYHPTDKGYALLAEVTLQRYINILI